MPYTTRWRYIEAPEEEHFSVGYVNVTVTLGSDGTNEAELEQQDIDATIVGGAAGGGGGGIASTVAVTLAAGAATV